MKDVLLRIAIFVPAVLAGTAVHHPVLYELWAGPVRWSFLYPSTIEGQTQALTDLNTVSLEVSIITALVVFCVLTGFVQSFALKRRTVSGV